MDKLTVKDAVKAVRAHFAQRGLSNLSIDPSKVVLRGNHAFVIVDGPPSAAAKYCVSAKGKRITKKS